MHHQTQTYTLGNVSHSPECWQRHRGRFRRALCCFWCSEGTQTGSRSCLVELFLPWLPQCYCWSAGWAATRSSSFSFKWRHATVPRPSSRLLQPLVLYLDRVVESFKNTNALGAQLQVHQPFHAQKDAMMLHSFLTHHHNDPRHCFLTKE